MKYYLFFIIIFCALTFRISVSAVGSGRCSNLSVYHPQQEPFYFLNDIPPSIKLPGRIDLSFFKNRLVVFMYRYRLQIPNAIETAIDRSLTVWSPWLKDDYSQIIVPRLDIEGGYKLMIEYKELNNDETKSLEMPFYVYKLNLQAYSSNEREQQISAVESSGSVRVAADERSSADRQSVTNRATAEQNDEVARKPAENSAGVKEPVEKKDTPVIEKLTYDQASVRIIASDSAEDKIEFRNLLADMSENPVKSANNMNQNVVAPAEVSSDNFYLVTDNPGIVSKNEYTNTPLHIAIINEENELTRMLISQGADLNIKNILELTPLHLAVMSDNTESVKELINAGAQIDISGNSGYTPLHIASELDYSDIASILVMNGADHRIKTNQGLSSRDIAKIQQNSDILRLLSNKGDLTIENDKTAYESSVVRNTLDIQNPDFKFTLPYDDRLVQQRHLFEILRIVSIPVLAVSTVTTAYLKSEANRYYSLSKVAETEELARLYYNKTSRLDTYSYITGGVSLTSAFGIIYSTIRNKSLSRQMYKIFY